MAARKKLDLAQVGFFPVETPAVRKPDRPQRAAASMPASLPAVEPQRDVAPARSDIGSGSWINASEARLREVAGKLSPYEPRHAALPPIDPLELCIRLRAAAESAAPPWLAAGIMRDAAWLIYQLTQETKDEG